jgi:hypothetical protein
VIAEVFFPPEPAGSDANLMKTFVIFGSVSFIYLFLNS